MQEASRCWVCGRTAEEIQASLDAESQEEIEIKRQMSQVAWFRSKFMESAALWRRSIPKEFKDMDFLFVTGNASQFRAIEQLGELIDAKKLMIDWLADASTRLRNGDQGSLGTVPLSSMDKAHRELTIKMLDQFEGRWHRQFADGTGGFPVGFDGLKLADGLEFLINGGLLYYDVQVQLLEFARLRASNAKPKWTIGLVEVKGNPKVSLCNVCESLIKELRVPIAESAKPGVRAQPSEKAEKVEKAQKVEKAEPVVVAAEAIQEPKGQPIVQQVPRVAQAKGAAEPVMDDLPPGVAEVVKKIGAPTKEAPKLRSLHDHRLKEDWDEMLTQKAENDGP
jgi:hypothetical protein